MQRKRIVLGGMLAACVVCLAACGTQGAPEPPPERGATQAVIRLASQAVEGYEWTYAISDEGVMRCVRESTVDASPEAGAFQGGMNEWVFEGVGPGEASITFRYLNLTDFDLTEPPDPAHEVTYAFAVMEGGGMEWLDASGSMAEIPEPELISP